VRHRDFRHSPRREFDADTYNPQPRFSQTFEALSDPPVSGLVKWFSPEKGFGFVELSDGSGDAFLHGSILAQSGIDAVQPGDTVEVQLVRDTQGRTSPRFWGSIRAPLLRRRHSDRASDR
jgi:CspA family cold shock protein